MFDNKLIKEIHDKVHEMDLRQHDMQKDIAQNTNDLADHIEGVVQNRVRIETLEDNSLDITKGYFRAFEKDVSAGHLSNKKAIRELKDNLESMQQPINIDDVGVIE